LEFVGRSLLIVDHCDKAILSRHALKNRENGHFEGKNRKKYQNSPYKRYFSSFLASNRPLGLGFPTFDSLSYPIQIILFILSKFPLFLLGSSFA